MASELNRRTRDLVGRMRSCPSVATVKPKRKNSEKRKEKSRYAARVRRSQESDIFGDIGRLLPFPDVVMEQMDKSSILRLAICYINIRHIMSSGHRFRGFQLLENSEDDIDADGVQEKDEERYLTKSSLCDTFDGFLMIVSQEGDLIYLSQNVETYLGLDQRDLMGNNLYDYCHPCDHKEIQDTLNCCLQSSVSSSSSGRFAETTPTSAKLVDNVSLFVRFKTTIKSKAKTVNIKSTPYKVIHCTGRRCHDVKFSTNEKLQCKAMRALILVGKEIPHPSDVTITAKGRAFITIHSVDMKYKHIDESITELLGFHPGDLVGKSFYTSFDARDAEHLEICSKILFCKGQVETGLYRFLVKTGGHVWVKTQATLISDKPSSSTPSSSSSVVCINYVLSGVENGAITSTDQLAAESASVGNGCAKPDEKDLLTNEEEVSPIGGLSPTFEVTQSLHLIDPFNGRLESPVEIDGYLSESERLACECSDPCDVCDRCACRSAPLSPLSGVDDFAEFPPRRLITTPIFDDDCCGPATPRDKTECETECAAVDFDCVPLTATNTIFAPRTSDMSDGFLIFSRDIHADDAYCGERLTDDQPDADLTHLAPEAGDTCIPLDLTGLPPPDHIPMDDIFVDILRESRTRGHNDLRDPASPPWDKKKRTSERKCIQRPAGFGPPTVAEEELTLSGDDERDSNGGSDSGIGSGSASPPRPAFARCDKMKFNCDFDDGLFGLHSLASELFNESGLSRDTGTGRSAVGDDLTGRCDKDDDDEAETTASLPDGRLGHSPLHNDPFLSHHPHDRLADRSDSPSVGDSPPLSDQLYYSRSSHSPSLADGPGGFGHSRRSSRHHGYSRLTSTGSSSTASSTASSWESPQSSTSFDLDLGTLTADGALDFRPPFGVDDEFVLTAGDDSIWDTFINSNLADIIISSDAFLPAKGSKAAPDPLPAAHATAGHSSGRGKASKIPPPLPLTSNLAILLQQVSGPVAVAGQKGRTAVKAAAAGKNKAPADVQMARDLNHHNYYYNTEGNQSTSDLRRVDHAQAQLHNASVQMSRTAAADRVTDDPQIGNHKATGIRTDGLAWTVAYGMGDCPVDLTGHNDGRRTTNGKAMQKRPYPLVSPAIAPTITPPGNAGRELTSVPRTDRECKRVKLNSHAAVTATNSVLMNLLVNGEDIGNGYARLQAKAGPGASGTPVNLPATKYNPLLDSGASGNVRPAQYIR